MSVYVRIREQRHVENWNTKDVFAASGNFVFCSCYVFPQMNFPSNQLDGEDNFLWGEVRLWPGEGSVRSDWGWGGCDPAARGSSASGAGMSRGGAEAPFYPAVVSGPCHTTALLFLAPLRVTVLRCASHDHISPPCPCVLGGVGRLWGAPGGMGHGQGEIPVEELGRCKVQS